MRRFPLLLFCSVFYYSIYGGPQDFRYDRPNPDELGYEIDDAAFVHAHLKKCKHRSYARDMYAKFVKKYSLPAEDQKKLLESGYKGYVQYDKSGSPILRGLLEGYYFKYWNISRVINALRAERCIKKNNLHLLTVPSKYVRETEQDDLEVWATDAACLSTDSYSPAVRETGNFDLQEIQQLVKFAEETNFSDWAYQHYNFNWARDKDGKLICLDLENKSFEACSIDHPGVCQLRKLYRHSMTDEARQWLKEKILFWDKCEAQHKKLPIPLSQNPDYDDADIDFEAVKEVYYHPKKRAE